MRLRWAVSAAVSAAAMSAGYATEDSTQPTPATSACCRSCCSRGCSTRSSTGRTPTPIRVQMPCSIVPREACLASGAFMYPSQWAWATRTTRAADTQLRGRCGLPDPAVKAGDESLALSAAVATSTSAFLKLVAASLKGQTKSCRAATPAIVARA